MENITFRIENIEYIETAENGRCYKIEDGKKARISRAAFDEAVEVYERLMEANDIEEQDTFTYTVVFKTEDGELETEKVEAECLNDVKGYIVERTAQTGWQKVGKIRKVAC